MITVHAARQYKDNEMEEHLFYRAHSRICDHPSYSKAWISETHGSTGLHGVVPQPVCRQYWAETSEMFIATCTFRIDDHLSFRVLASSTKPIVAQIRRFMIHASSSSARNFPVYWQDVFSSALVGRFVNLEGFRLTGKATWTSLVHEMSQNVLTNPFWRTSSFRQRFNLSSNTD